MDQTSLSQKRRDWANAFIGQTIFVYEKGGNGPATPRKVVSILRYKRGVKLHLDDGTYQYKQWPSTLRI